jgi:adenine-specific DNA-methyltransferase
LISSGSNFSALWFIDYIDDKNFLIDSYTKFSNKVGLTLSNKHIQQINEVVLSFPFKDCVLEGGQSKDDEKCKEIFFNEVLAKDEINRLLNKKVITSAKKYTQNGVSDKVNFNRNENGLIKDNLIIKGNNLLALHTINTFKYACSLSSHCTKITPSSLNKSRAISRRFYGNIF